MSADVGGVSTCRLDSATFGSSPSAFDPFEHALTRPGMSEHTDATPGMSKEATPGMSDDLLLLYSAPLPRRLFDAVYMQLAGENNNRLA